MADLTLLRSAVVWARANGYVYDGTGEPCWSRVSADHFTAVSIRRTRGGVWLSIISDGVESEMWLNSARAVVDVLAALSILPAEFSPTQAVRVAELVTQLAQARDEVDAQREAYTALEKLEEEHCATLDRLRDELAQLREDVGKPSVQRLLAHMRGDHLGEAVDEACQACMTIRIGSDADHLRALLISERRAHTAALDKAVTSYELKVADLARETEAVETLARVLLDDNHSPDGFHAQGDRCRLCAALKKALRREPAPATHTEPVAVLCSRCRKAPRADGYTVCEPCAWAPDGFKPAPVPAAQHAGLTALGLNLEADLNLPIGLVRGADIVAGQPAGGEAAGYLRIDDTPLNGENDVKTTVQISETLNVDLNTYGQVLGIESLTGPVTMADLITVLGAVPAGQWMTSDDHAGRAGDCA